MALLLTNEERHHYTDKAPWSPYWSDSFNSSVPWYLEKINYAPNLVICYGDSWTWGDSLGTASAVKKNSDDEYRTQHVYGSKLSNMLDADFVNCALPGIFNYWIHDRLQILIDYDLQRLSTHYNKIWIIVTLTEVGRDFDFENYVNDFKKFYNWNGQHPKDILIQCENYDFTRLQNVNQRLPNNCKLIVGRNFTDTFEENKSILKNLIQEPWAKILFVKQDINVDANIPMMSFGIDKFDQFIKKYDLDSLEYKQWMNDEILPNAKKMIDALDKSIYNYKKASKHPTEQGHVLWADHLYKFINEQT